VCVELDSLPPIPPISGAAVSHEDLTLEAADGNRFAAFAATPDEPAAKGVVILPVTFPYGVHCAAVDVDTETGEVEISAYTIGYACPRKGSSRAPTGTARRGFAADCHRLQPRGSIKAPSFVAEPGYIRLALLVVECP
jgi:hypothetical protein